MLKILKAREIVGPWVFPGNGRHGHAEEPKAALAEVKKPTGRHITPHDLRRTFITVATPAV